MDPIFADGLMFKEPRDGAPSFVKGSLSVNVNKFITFLNDYKNDRGWLNLDMKESKKGGIYFQLNTWKAEKTETGWKPIPQTAEQIEEMQNLPKINYPTEELDESPF